MGWFFILVNQRGGFVNYANVKLHTGTANPDVEISKFEQKILGANVNFDNGIANLIDANVNLHFIILAFCIYKRCFQMQ